MKYEEMRCKACGGTLEKIGEKTYQCKFCHAKWDQCSLDDYREAIRASVKGEVTDALIAKRDERIANIRRNLYQAVHKRYIDMDLVRQSCSKLQEYLPEDLQARFYGLSWKDPYEVNRFLDELDVEKADKWLIEDMINYVRNPLRMENLASLRYLIERAFQDDLETQEKYNTLLDEDEVVNKDGVYDETLPRDVFLAYKSEDGKLVNELCDYLEKNGLKCFLSSRNLKHGRNAVNYYEDRIYAAIDHCEVIVFVSTYLSRTVGDARNKELPYVEKEDKGNAPAEYRNNYERIPQKYKKPRVEYLCEGYRKDAANEWYVRKFFKGFQYRKSKEAVYRAVDEYLRTGYESEEAVPPQAGAVAVKYCLACGAENTVNVNICGQCGKREFGTREEYEERCRESERKEVEQKETARREAERKEAEQKEAERKEAVRREEKRGEVGKKAEMSVAKIDLADFEIKDGVLRKYNGRGGDVIIPNSVTSIGERAFSGCESLTSITIPSSVTSIGERAFSGCESLTSIAIPSSVTSIELRAFNYCTGLEEIKVEKENPVYHSDGNCLIETESGTLVLGCKNSRIPADGSVTSIGEGAFSGCESLTSITIPSSVTSIGECAFEGCESLTSITIPNSVTSIGEYAFDGCESLTSITIPNSVTSIGFGAFGANIGLEEIKVEKGNPVYHSDGNCLIETESGALVSGCKNSKIPADGSVTSIENYAFSDCESLKSIIIPNSVTSIGGLAFSYCSSLTSINIPDSVTSIGEHALDGCKSLTSITIPNSVTSIEAWAFSGCIGLEEIKVEKGNPVYHSDGNCLIKTESGTLVAGCKNSRIPADGSVTSIGDGAFGGCESLTSITIPNSVTSIEDMTFYGCKSLTSITIPNSVTSIGEYVFHGCKSLASISIPNSVTSIGDMTFYGCKSLTSITIPNSVTSIGKYAFSGCESLISITIPNSVTSIERSAFDDGLKIYCHHEKPLEWPQGWDSSLEGRIIWINEDKAVDIASITFKGTMMYEKKKCNKCGGELERHENEVYVCPYCETSYLAEEFNNGQGFYCGSDLIELQCARCGGRLEKTENSSYVCSRCQTCYTIGELYYQNGNELYEKGNLIEALKWYRKAVEQGNATAQCFLGACYEYGQGVKQSYAEAIKWYTRAAEQGNEDAKKVLERLEKDKKVRYKNENL